VTWCRVLETFSVAAAKVNVETLSRGWRKRFKNEEGRVRELGLKAGSGIMMYSNAEAVSSRRKQSIFLSSGYRNQPITSGTPCSGGVVSDASAYEVLNCLDYALVILFGSGTPAAPKIVQKIQGRSAAYEHVISEFLDWLVKSV